MRAPGGGDSKIHTGIPQTNLQSKRSKGWPVFILALFFLVFFFVVVVVAVVVVVVVDVVAVVVVVVVVHSPFSPSFQDLKRLC